MEQVDPSVTYDTFLVRPSPSKSSIKIPARARFYMAFALAIRLARQRLSPRQLTTLYQAPARHFKSMRQARHGQRPDGAAKFHAKDWIRYRVSRSTLRRSNRRDSRARGFDSIAIPTCRRPLRFWKRGRHRFLGSGVFSLHLEALPSLRSKKRRPGHFVQSEFSPSGADFDHPNCEALQTLISPVRRTEALEFLPSRPPSVTIGEPRRGRRYRPP